MKARRFNKRLFLNRKTVAHLSSIEMKRARGGEPPTLRCPTWGEGSCIEWCYSIAWPILCPAHDPNP